MYLICKPYKCYYVFIYSKKVLTHIYSAKFYLKQNTQKNAVLIYVRDFFLFDILTFKIKPVGFPI